MRIVLLRHATRDASMIDDGGLNALGHRQADTLAARLEPNGPLPVPTVLFASPKRRARETLHAVAHHLSLPLVVTSALDEKRSNETEEKFLERIRQWGEALTEEYQGSNEVVWACTHMDWLEQALIVFPTDISELDASLGFSPGESLSFEIEGDVWKTVARNKV